MCTGPWEGNNISLLYSHVHLPPALGDHTNPIVEGGNHEIAEEVLHQAEGGNQLAGMRVVDHRSGGRVLEVAESSQVLEESGRHLVLMPVVVKADRACNCSAHHMDHGSHRDHHVAPHLQNLSGQTHVSFFQKLFTHSCFEVFLLLLTKSVSIRILALVIFMLMVLMSRIP